MTELWLKISFPQNIYKDISLHTFFSLFLTENLWKNRENVLSFVLWAKTEGLVGLYKSWESGSDLREQKWIRPNFKQFRYKSQYDWNSNTLSYLWEMNYFKKKFDFTTIFNLVVQTGSDQKTRIRIRQSGLYWGRNFISSF